MREIKFRAWIEKEKIMTFFGINAIALNNGAIGNISVIQDAKIMQFIGLKDKNGKEIFEGDILRLYHSRGKWASKGNVVVIWENCEFSAEKISESVIEDLESLGNYRFDNYDIEVIGNIYENPELLEEKK